MKNKGGDKKAEELLYRVSLKESFKDDLVNIRNKYDIPVYGFKTIKEAGGWRFSHRGNIIGFIVNESEETANRVIKEREYDEDIIKILKRHNLPVTLLYLLEEYILYNKPFTIKNKKVYFPCAIDSPRFDGGPISEEEHWKYMGIPYVRLLIHSEANRSDVKKYIDDNWRHIKMYFDTNTNKKKRVRVSTNKDRDSLIYELSKKTGKELKDMQSSEFRDAQMLKNNRISHIIFEKTGEKIGQENIKRIISKEKTGRKL